MVDKHGLPMKGLKKASGYTCDWERTGFNVQISYDKRDGKVMYGLVSDNGWLEYHSSEIITIMHTNTHCTMQEIADAIYERVNY